MTAARYVSCLERLEFATLSASHCVLINVSRRLKLGGKLSGGR